MNKREVSELFALLMTAYPSAEMFRAPDDAALAAKLKPTIALWTTCLADVDADTANRAAIHMIRVCKYPPTIAELREQIDVVRRQDRTVALERLATAYLRRVALEQADQRKLLADGETET